MPDRPPELDAAIRALRGESDLDALMPALDTLGLARVIACAPETHPLVRAIAALCGGLPSLLDAPTRAGPALHDALVHLIGTPAGRAALRAWTEVAPVAWGAAHADALITAAHAAMCDADVAAALIGPCDESAALLHTASNVAFAFRRWGTANAADPSAWADALSPGNRRRLITNVLKSPSAISSCLPWLPPDVAHAVSRNCTFGDALTAFAVASPTARAQHAAVLQTLVDRALPTHLAALTRLACVMDADDVWRRVQTLIQASPEDAWRVVAAAPWHDLPKGVRAAILERADESDVCAAVAVATAHERKGARGMTRESAAAFFAALAPAVWDALDTGSQQRWRCALWRDDVHLAVRALGLRPEVLARAEIDPTLVRAAQRHARDERTLRWALLPVALRRLPHAAAHALVAAMPTLPSDPGAFFAIAWGRDDPSGLASAGAALRSPADLALAVTLRRCASGVEPVSSACTALTDALRGRTWNDLAPILALLRADTRAALLPDRDALVERLAHPDRQDVMRQALDRLAALPPEVSVPARFALNRWESWTAIDAADALARALHAAGDVFLSIMDALADERLRQALLPLPEGPALARALCALAQDDPVTARRLAHALQTHDRRTALLALLTMPPRHAGAVWQALDDGEQRVIDAEVAAASPDADLPAVRDPIAALALAAMHAVDVDLRVAGVAALAARPDVLRACWMALPLDARQSLLVHPAVADLQTAPERSAARRGLRRGRA